MFDSKDEMVAVTKFKTGLGKGTTRVLKKTAAWKGQESTDTPYDEKETPLYTFSSSERVTNPASSGVADSPLTWDSDGLLLTRSRVQDDDEGGRGYILAVQ